MWPLKNDHHAGKALKRAIKGYTAINPPHGRASGSEWSVHDLLKAMLSSLFMLMGHSTS
jgi:hypothetical protein